MKLSDIKNIITHSSRSYVETCIQHDCLEDVAEMLFEYDIEESEIETISKLRDARDLTLDDIQTLKDAGVEPDNFENMLYGEYESLNCFIEDYLLQNDSNNELIQFVDKEYYWTNELKHSFFKVCICDTVFIFNNV
jgi:hypothetical protein